MKKIYQIILLLCLSVCIAGCSKGKTQTVQKEKRTTNKSTETQKRKKENKSKILIAYFTRADNIKIDPKVDATSSASINKKGSSYQGNVAIMADVIKDVTGGDTFSILTTEYYPTRYRDSTNTAEEEQKNNARPKLSSHVKNMKDYDVIFLGYPDWWGGLPMPVYTFLEEYDFTGKTIIPFASHEGSGLGNGPSEIEKLCPKAKVRGGLAVRGSEVDSSKADIEKWIMDLNL